MNFNELWYGIIPFPITKNFIKHRTESKLLEPLGIYPRNLELNNIPLDECISFMPYCAKPNNCPLNKKYTRKSQKCLRLMGKECNIKCSIKETINVLFDNGFTSDRIFIIDRDSNLFPWLEQKHLQGYNYFFAGFGCYYGVAYALSMVMKIGFKGGLAGFVEGNYCRNMRDYMGMEEGDKGRNTEITPQSIEALKKAFSYKIE